MLDVFNIPQPQNCNIQVFYGDGAASSTTQYEKTWVKPRGVSHVYMLLIGAGGNGVSGNRGGGSGAVTVWYGAAQNVPDSLTINVPRLGAQYDTTVNVRCISGTRTTLLTATGATSGTGAAAATATAFAASGFYQSIAGQTGATTDQTASTTTFLSGGAQNNNNDIVANYGYDTTQNSAANGYFLFQPIIVGVGGGGEKNGGIGCGGGGATSGVGRGGPGFVLIASW
jgi:hypothetical protein